MRIKRFFELFDTTDIKAENEIDYLSGNFKDLGKKIDYDFQKETIGNFLTKISDYHFPFFRAFIKASKESDGDIEIDNFFVYTSTDEDEFYIFCVESENYRVTFGIKINKTNDYDVYIYLDDFSFLDDTSKNPGVDLNGITYTELVNYIKRFYIPFIKKGGFDKFLDYNIEALSVNN